MTHNRRTQNPVLW